MIQAAQGRCAVVCWKSASVRQTAGSTPGSGKARRKRKSQISTVRRLSEVPLSLLSFQKPLNQRVPGSSPGAPTKVFNILASVSEDQRERERSDAFRVCAWRSRQGARCGRDSACLEHDPEKWKPVFPRDKRGTRLRGDHAQTKS